MSSINGFINIDKPRGVTSRGVVDAVLKLVRPAKAGHAGTLDPLATGVVVVAVGAATKLISAVQEMEKAYEGTFRLGVTSETDDAESELTPVPDAPSVTAEEIQAVLPEFFGQIEQMPPKYSAIKIRGRRAYQLARRGHAPDLKPRRVRIDRLELTDFSPPHFKLAVTCGSGTYLRALGRDIGARLGTGAVMMDLVRTRVGRFALEDAVPPEALSSQTLHEHLAPLEHGVFNVRRHTANERETDDVAHGRTLNVPERFAPGERCAVLDPHGRLIAIAEAVESGERLAPRIVFNAVG